MTVLFLIDDLFENNVGQLDDKRPKPGIFLQQRLRSPSTSASQPTSSSSRTHDVLEYDFWLLDAGYAFLITNILY